MRIYNHLAAVLVLSLCFGASLARAESGELDSEINDLQVHLQKPKANSQAAKLIKSKATKKTAPKVTQLDLKPVPQAPVYHSEVADNSISVLPPGPEPVPKSAPRARKEEIIEEPVVERVPEPAKIESSQDDQPAGVESTSAKPSFFSKVTGIFQKVTLLPAVSISTFDGDDKARVVPTGVNYPVAANAAGTALVDLNLGLGNFVLQTGIDYISAGAETGFAPYQGFTSFTYNDKVTLRYVGVPLSLKYNFSGASQSGFFAKAGINPIYLSSHTYMTYTGYNNEFRLGGYNQWDFLFTAGVGYSLNITDRFQAVLDISGYQGTASVFTTYTVYNLGGMAGIGLSYLL